MAGVDEVAPEPVELVEEEPSLPVEWPRNGNRVKDMLAAQDVVAHVEPLKQQPLTQNPIFHEPVVLKPDVSTRARRGNRDPAYY
jgi:S-DNA-T family DNA segregation ATPase FtsK/SpoIIIE